MKDIRFWRTEYLRDIIGCDQSNRSPKRNTLDEKGAAPQEWIFFLSLWNEAKSYVAYSVIKK